MFDTTDGRRSVEPEPFALDMPGDGRSKTEGVRSCIGD